MKKARKLDGSGIENCSPMINGEERRVVVEILKSRSGNIKEPRRIWKEESTGRIYETISRRTRTKA